MAKRNRNTKNKKTSNNEEKIEIGNENEGKAIESQTEEQESTSVEIEGKTENKKTGLFNQILVGSFVTLLALPTGYYYFKVSPEHRAEIEKLTKKSDLIRKGLEVKLADAQKEKKELSKNLKIELASNLKNQEQSALIQKKETKKSVKVNEELSVTQTKVTALEKKLQEETIRKSNLQEKLMFVVTKGKELEDKFKELKSASYIKVQESKGELEKKIQDALKLSEELLATQTKVTTFEKKLLEDTQIKNELAAQLMFVITKGKELEDEFKALKSASHIKEQVSKEKLEKETKNSLTLNEGLLTTQAKITELKSKLSEELTSNTGLQEKLMFVVTKGKELEDKVNALRSSIHIINKF
jgi:hypothetical protein